MSGEDGEQPGNVWRYVKEAVSQFLPGLPDDLLATMLNELGVEFIEDLTLLEEKDLLKYLKPIQSRKFMKGIKDGLVTLHLEKDSAPDARVTSSPAQSSSYTRAAFQTFQPPNEMSVRPPTITASTSNASQLGVPWHMDFNLNWEQVSPAIRVRVEKKERPSPDERRAFVVMLVDQMMQHDLNPTRTMCHNVVGNVVRSHPKTFADIGFNGDIVGDGCHSLLQQVKTRVEYKNRKNTLARRRREGRRRTVVPGEVSPVDQSRCVRRGPKDLLEGGSETTMNTMKKDLLNIYSEEGLSGTDRAEPIMRRTYVIQRIYLNSVPAPTMSEIQLEWPYFFTQKCLFSHFELLMDIDVVKKLQEAITQRGQTILNYCETLDNSDIRHLLGIYDSKSDKAACIVMLLMALLQEPKESLMIEVDSLATALDISTAELPSTPCLIIQGDVMKPCGWFVAIDKTIVMGPHPLFVHGVAALFSCYYIFNIQYPAAGSSTLEFIQRCFLGIHPEKGSKAEMRKGFNPRVSTLLREIADFEWMA